MGGGDINQWQIGASIKCFPGKPGTHHGNNSFRVVLGAGKKKAVVANHLLMNNLFWRLKIVQRAIVVGDYVKGMNFILWSEFIRVKWQNPYLTSHENCKYFIKPPKSKLEKSSHDEV